MPFFPAVLKKNEAIYQHSDEKWKIRINEDNWTLLENQVIPQAAKDSGFLDSDMPLDQLIELGILVKLEEATKGKKFYFLHTAKIRKKGTLT